jgi:hypothetical protein
MYVIIWNRHIREEGLFPTRSRQFCDGDIYRNPSYYNGNVGMLDEENKWLQEVIELEKQISNKAAENI